MTTYERREFDRHITASSLVFPSVSLARLYIDLIIGRPLTDLEFQDVLVTQFGHTPEHARHVVDSLKSSKL